MEEDGTKFVPRDARGEGDVGVVNCCVIVRGHEGNENRLNKCINKKFIKTKVYHSSHRGERKGRGIS